MEYHRDGRNIDAWEPFVWEYSSGLVILCLIPLLLKIDSLFPIRETNWQKSLPAHVVATIPFSVLHVGGMVGLRKAIYTLNQRTYDFGHIPYEFFLRVSERLSDLFLHLRRHIRLSLLSSQDDGCQLRY